jgi:hypothetical protein
VAKLVSTTRLKRAGTTGWLGKSTRANLMPWLIVAGLIATLTIFPEWTPMPEHEAERAVVLWEWSRFMRIYSLVAFGLCCYIAEAPYRTVKFNDQILFAVAAESIDISKSYAL